ncbi:MAG: hypothetical protein M3552_18470 [Planctomycetota bacterium]|nr:hypothetical protein [Planctomycetota bacterium]
MKTIQNGRLVVALSALFLSLAGCGASSDQPELGQVSGTIMLDGKPLSGVAVVFQPDSGRPARGLTDTEGKYELTYIRETLGTKIGHNRVEIAPDEEGENPAESDGDVDGPTVQKPVKSGKPVIPARYNTRSELEADVKPGENTFDFALES